MLAQLLDRLPAEVTILGTLPDHHAQTEAALANAAAGHDLIITTGGVSVGDHDHVRPALESLGQVHFWRLAIRPGKPVLFGTIGRTAMVGLPGNPVSAMVTFLMIARPVIDALSGAPARPAPGFSVPLAEPVRKPPTLRDFPRARLEFENGAVRARPYRDQSSNLITSLAWADGILDLPAGRSEYAAGEAVIYRPFEALFG
jgi:molybdopterin molybdotransferase